MNKQEVRVLGIHFAGGSVAYLLTTNLRFSSSRDCLHPIPEASGIIENMFIISPAAVKLREFFNWKF